jgi:hypothetical protein
MRMVGIALVLVGCGKSKSNLVLTDANNFDIANSDMAMARFQVEEGTDFCFDWSSMTTDIRGRPLDPAAIEQVLLVDFAFPEDELISKIIDDNYVPQEGALPWVFDNFEGRTEACASETTALGTPLPLATLAGGESRTWLLSLATLPGGVVEVQQVMLIEPVTGAPGGVATFTDGLSSITIEADLGSPPLETQAGAGPYTLDWGELKKDVNGATWDSLIGDSLFIVNYDGAIGDIEADFLLLDYHAAELYELDVRGKTNALLDEATDVDGKAFPGFTTAGTWIVGITCSTCISPVPLAIAVVEVEAE